MHRVILRIYLRYTYLHMYVFGIFFLLQFRFHNSLDGSRKVESVNGGTYVICTLYVIQ